MSDFKMCNLMFIPWIVFIGIMAYTVSPFALWLILAGWSCPSKKDK